MKIGLITGEFPPMPGGVGHFSRILAERIQAQGHSVRLLSRTGSNWDKLEITTVPGWRLKQVWKIKTWADEHALDLINLQFQTAAFDMSPWIHFLPSLLDQPIVTTFHDLRHPYLFPGAGRLRDWVVRHLAGSADGLIATNPEDEQKLAGAPMRSVIPIGSNIISAAASDESAARWREELSLSDSTTLIGHFGFVQAIKGIDFLVDALAELRQNGHDARLLFIGGQRNAVNAGAGESYRESLEDRIRGYGLGDVLRWTGFLPEAEVAACLQAVDIVILPYLDGASYRRGSLMAAINYGCAIVTTQPTVAHETFIHGENIWLIERQSAAAISDAVIHLIQNPQTANHLRAGARQLRRRFDWDVIARDTLAFYEEVLRGTGQHPMREGD
ncbi:MAG: glycosyltransferase family 4 protein [Chloroflexota bacterium]|nr:glycosyltransferase family 4 protein [Chloroflexota bacterium]